MPSKVTPTFQMSPKETPPFQTSPKETPPFQRTPKVTPPFKGGRGDFSHFLCFRPYKLFLDNIATCHHIMQSLFPVSESCHDIAYH